MLVYNAPDAPHLPHQDVTTTATQSTEVVDVENCFGFAEIESGLRNSNVSQIVRKPTLKVAWLSSLQFLAADENGRYTTR